MEAPSPGGPEGSGPNCSKKVWKGLKTSAGVGQEGRLHPEGACSGEGPQLCIWIPRAGNDFASEVEVLPSGKFLLRFQLPDFSRR